MEPSHYIPPSHKNAVSPNTHLESEITGLPAEVFVNIFSFLDNPNLQKIVTVNREFTAHSIESAKRETLEFKKAKEFIIINLQHDLSRLEYALPAVLEQIESSDFKEMPLNQQTSLNSLKERLLQTKDQLSQTIGSHSRWEWLHKFLANNKIDQKYGACRDY